MLKLLHTADIHLGAKFLSLGKKGAAQREQIKASFKKLISQAIEEEVGIVLIAGDLFDANQQSQANIDLVVEQFNLLAQRNIPVCLIPGTHDCFDSGSIYRKVNFVKMCPNLTLFTDSGWNHKEFPSLKLTVYGKPNYGSRSYKSPLEGLRRSTESQYHVAMAHGSLSIPGKTAEDDHVFTIDQIWRSQMHYIALGHHHHSYACSDKKVIAWYSGSPEVISMDQKEQGSILMVGISEQGRVEVEVKRIGLHSCDELEIDLSDVEGLSQLKSKIAEGASPNLIRTVILKGLRNEDMHLSPEELEADLAEEFFHLHITDRSHPKVSELTETTPEDQSILARFNQSMKEHIKLCEGEEREIAEDALQYGLALLQGKEVL
jgi:DNA repair exonuclease SbcCD nuclease subunit